DHAIPDGWTAAFSFCPNNVTLKRRYQSVFQEMARDYEIAGFFIGHNRFAPLGNEFGNLFGCGCADCIRAAGELGYDFEAMKQALSRLRMALRELDPRQVRELAALELGALDFLSGLGVAGPVVDWIRFRCDLIARTMSDFRAAVKEVRREVIVGQDSVPPSFSLFSGHNYRQLEDAQDYLCPNVAHPILFIVY